MNRNNNRRNRASLGEQPLFRLLRPAGGPPLPALPQLRLHTAHSQSGRQANREVSGEPAQPPPLRILQVTARYLPYVGGTEILTYEVSRRLAEQGHEVTVLTSDPTGTLPTREVADGVQIRRVRAWPAHSDYYFAPGIPREIVGGDWDLIHCQGAHTFVAPIAMLAARHAGIPYLVSFHSGGHSSRLRNGLRGLQWKSLRPLLARAERLIAVSQFEAAAFQQRLGLPDDRFTIIPNGSHLPGIEALPEPTGAEGTLIVSVGRLERYKGHHRVIAALPEIATHFPDVRLRIIGAGPYEKTLRQLAHKTGVADRVEIGAVAGHDRLGMAKALCEASLVILLSDYESQGISVFEAIALGRPVLVAETSALTELAHRGLVRATSLGSTPGQVAGAVVTQLRWPHRPPKVNLPTWEACYENHLALYREVLREAQCAS